MPHVRPADNHQTEPPQYTREQAEEAQKWTEAALKHDAEGHRPFTGAGYQKQHDMVHGKKGKEPSDSIFDKLGRAFFGPSA